MHFGKMFNTIGGMFNMKGVSGLFIAVMFLLGATIRLDSIKYPKALMLINRILIVTYITYTIWTIARILNS